MQYAGYSSAGQINGGLAIMADTYNSTAPRNTETVLLRLADIGVSLFEDALWESPEGSRRSRELTLLYLMRYRHRYRIRPVHHHDLWEGFVLLHGVAVLETEQAQLPLTINRICIAPPGVAHRVVAHQPVDLIFFGMRGKILRMLGLSAVRYRDSREIAARIVDMWRLPRASKSVAVGVQLDGMLRTVVGMLLATHTTADMRSVESFMGQLTRHLHACLEQAVSVPQMAEAFGMSERVLYQRVKNATGVGPLKYLTGLRMHVARELLRQTDWPITEVAGRVGYPESSHFCTVFRKANSCSPCAYRESAARRRQEAGPERAGHQERLDA